MASPLTLAQALDLAAAAFASAVERGLRVSVSIVDEASREIVTQRMDGAPGFTAGIARSKASSAAVMRRDTSAVADLAAQVPEVITLVAGQVGFDFTTLKGGVVLTADGEVIGAIGVSGATSDEDVELAQHAAATVLG